MPEITRRNFLKLTSRVLLTLSGLLSAGGLLRFFAYRTESPEQTSIVIGPVENFPLGSRTVLSELPAVLIHNNSGFTAISLTCTHLGCTVELEGDEFICPCHGSRFNLNGAVERGPAKQPLTKLDVQIDENGRLILSQR